VGLAYPVLNHDLRISSSATFGDKIELTAAANQALKLLKQPTPRSMPLTHALQSAYKHVPSKEFQVPAVDIVVYQAFFQSEIRALLVGPFFPPFSGR
jgi:hypothetical protein